LRMFIKKLKSKFIRRFSLLLVLCFTSAVLSVYFLIFKAYFNFVLSFFLFLFFFYLIYLELKRLFSFIDWIFNLDYKKEIPKSLLEKEDDLKEFILKLRDKFKEEEKLIEEKKILEEYRTSFLSRITHELLSPISVMKGYLALLRMGEEDIKKLDYIEKVLRSVARLESMINSFVVSTREGYYPKSFEFKIFDFTELIFEIYEEYLPIAQGKGINFVIKLPPFPNTVIGDPEALRSAISNLVSNALKFTSSGGKVSMESVKEDGKIKFIIRDTGPGIRKEEIPFIFRPYFQGKSSRTKSGGMGLGLTIAKEIIEAHGSEIYVDSEPGKGTAFYFYLPLKT